VVAGRLVARMDQRLLLGFGCLVNGIALYWMSHLTLTVDYWSLVWPRFVQGFGMGFLFLPLTTLSISTIPKAQLPNATAAFHLIPFMRRIHATPAAEERKAERVEGLREPGGEAPHGLAAVE